MTANVDVILGIDPGLDGALAFLPVDGSTPWVIDIPTVTVVGSRKKRRHCEPSVLAAELRAVQRDHSLFAAIESVASRPGQGAPSTFSLGETFGMLLGGLAALQIPHTKIAPARWKHGMGLPTGADKETSRAMALRLWPSLASSLARKRDEGRAEALLLAETLDMSDAYEAAGVGVEGVRG